MILKDLNIKINKGEFVGIIGQSGSGKSTLMKILLGYYRPMFGKICFGGHELLAYGYTRLREHISYVSQDCHLFQMSIYENILLGNPMATRQEVIEAAKKAGVHTFVSDLEQGYDTIIDEKGENVSGGQRQRIALARAFLKDSELLLMDEGTGALDDETEQIIIDTLDQLKGKQTIVMISHKKNIVTHADRVYEMQNGRLYVQN